MPNWRMFPACAPALCLSTVLANDDPDQLNVLRSADALDDTPGIEAPHDADVWDIRLGVLGAVHPDYQGSDDYKTSVAPYFRINWRDRIILGGRSLRARVLNGGPLSMGPLVRLRGGRDEGDNEDLAGLGDDERSIEVGGFMRYRIGPYRFRMTATQDVADGHNGALVEVGAGAQIPFDRPWFLLMGKVTWADQDYTKSFFGVTASESRRSGLRQFDTSAGVRDVGFTIASRLPIWREMSLVAAFNYEKLLGDAADSPLTQAVGDADQVSANMGLIYRF